MATTGFNIHLQGHDQFQRDVTLTYLGADGSRKQRDFTLTITDHLGQQVPLTNANALIAAINTQIPLLITQMHSINPQVDLDNTSNLRLSFEHDQAQVTNPLVFKKVTCLNRGTNQPIECTASNLGAAAQNINNQFIPLLTPLRALPNAGNNGFNMNMPNPFATLPSGGTHGFNASGPGFGGPPLGGPSNGSNGFNTSGTGFGGPPLGGPSNGSNGFNASTTGFGGQPSGNTHFNATGIFGGQPQGSQPNGDGNAPVNNPFSNSSLAAAQSNNRSFARTGNNNPLAKPSNSFNFHRAHQATPLPNGLFEDDQDSQFSPRPSSNPGVFQTRSESNSAGNASLYDPAPPPNSQTQTAFIPSVAPISDDTFPFLSSLVTQKNPSSNTTQSSSNTKPQSGNVSSSYVSLLDPDHEEIAFVFEDPNKKDGKTL